MARTERRRYTYDGHTNQTHIETGARDSKGQCWCCSGWKRPARRKDRHEAKAAVRRDPSSVSVKARSIW